MIETYLRQRMTLKGVVAIMDIRRNPGQEELDLIHWLKHHALSSILVLTKADKLSKTKQINQQKAFTKEFDIDQSNLIIFSAKTRQGKEDLWFSIEKLLDNEF